MTWLIQWLPYILSFSNTEGSAVSGETLASRHDLVGFRRFGTEKTCYFIFPSVYCEHTRF